MKDFLFYSNKAIERMNLRGFNELAYRINISSASMSALKNGKCLPTDENMMRIAELAGLPVDTALIDLNIWRSKNNPELQKKWINIRNMFK